VQVRRGHSIVALAGSGSFADLSATQTIGGSKTFSIVPKSSQDASGSTDLVRKSQFDTALSAKAASSHIHAVADVTGLQATLDGKLDDSQATAFGLSLLDEADAATARTTLGLGTAATSSASTFAGASHAHAIGDVTGLQTVLDGKAATMHAHAIGDVTDLQAALDGKAASAHAHAIADVTGLQAALDAKAPLASPALTGTPTAPTAASGTNTTQLATPSNCSRRSAA
jgi:hypothetical protein